MDWVTASQQVGVLSGQIAQVYAELIQVAAQVINDEAWQGAGIRSVEHFLEVKTGLDRHTVRKIVTVARRVGELPELMVSLHQGRLTLDQAAVVSAHTPASYSTDVTEFAEHATVTQLRRGLKGWFHDTDGGNSTDGDDNTDGESDTGTGDGVKPLSLPPVSTVQVSMSDDRFRLSFVTSDLVAGALVEQAIREAKDSLFTDGLTQATLADGLIEVAQRSLSSLSEPSRGNRYQVLVHLDMDGQSWLHKNGALPQHLVKRYTCQGQLTPIWESDGKPVSVGRSQRIVPDRVRRLIEDRDKGCRFPGCHSTGYLEVHHLTHWRDGGTTDPANLACLCSYHHGEHHRGAFIIDGDPERLDGLTFRTHHGWPITTPRAEPPPGPDRPPPKWREITGERMDTRWLTFKPNPTSTKAAAAVA